MASQHIEIPSTASRLSADVRRFVDSARALQELGVKIKDVADQVSSGGDWAAMATKLGLGADEAAAETVYNLITNVQDDLTAADYNALIDRLG
jgi:hypothetical protein